MLLGTLAGIEAQLIIQNTAILLAFLYYLWSSDRRRG